MAIPSLAADGSECLLVTGGAGFIGAFSACVWMPLVEHIAKHAKQGGQSVMAQHQFETEIARRNRSILSTRYEHPDLIACVKDVSMS